MDDDLPPEPNRVLDAEVARVVFGHDVRIYDDQREHWIGTQRFSEPERPIALMHGWSAYVPEYSTDWNHMGLVLARMKTLGWHYQITSDDHDTSVRFYRWNPDAEFDWTDRKGNPLPENVALAALKAVGPPDG